MRLLFILLIVVAAPLRAHEFWIAPENHTVSSGERLRAGFRNGQNFSGIALPYLPQSSAVWEMYLDDTHVTIPSRIGDRPALNVAPLGDGMHVIGHVTTPKVVKYDALSDFLEFADHKGLTSAAADHAARGLPDQDFAETYTRFAKSLIAVGDQPGAGRNLGYDAELIALTDPRSGTATVELRYQGAVMPDRQLELFIQPPEGEVHLQILRSDAAGTVTVQVQPEHRYLLNAVILRAPSAPLAEQTGAVWESLWASLTFAP